MVVLSFPSGFKDCSEVISWKDVLFKRLGSLHGIPMASSVVAKSRLMEPSIMMCTILMFLRVGSTTIGHLLEVDVMVEWLASDNSIVWFDHLSIPRR